MTRDVLLGQASGEKRPDLLLCVLDTTRLRRHLRLVLAAQRLGLPCVLVLNMVDRAQALGLSIDPAAGPAADHQRVQALLSQLGLADTAPPEPSDRIDGWVLHPVFGPLLLVTVLFAMFQAVYAWAALAYLASLSVYHLARAMGAS